MLVHRVRSPLARALVLATLATGSIALLPRSGAAQETVVASGPAKMTLDDIVAEWASLERPLLGVADLSDLQRDAIELLENRYRKQFNDEAEPIRQARIAFLQRGPFDRQAIERALQRMTELRKRQLTQLRGVLTDAQRVSYDANLKKIAAEEAAAETMREREAAFYTP